MVELMRQGFALQEKFKEKIRGSEIDKRGHLLGDLKEIDLFMLTRIPAEQQSQLASLLDAPGEPMQIQKGSCLRRCYTCEGEPALMFDGERISAATECKYPDGYVYEVELNVPSGKMVVDDDLRPLFGIHGDFDINTMWGCRQTTEAYAEIGCAHGCVGNTCPGVYRQKDGKYIIANGYYKKDSCEDEDHVAPPGEDVQGICTDLWWYSFVDYDEFIRRAGRVSEKDIADKILEVEPGVYRFRHLIHDLKRYPEGTWTEGQITVFAEFERVRDPDPVRDFQSEQDAMNYTAGQVIHRSIRDYPSLYGGKDGIRYDADHIMCDLGGGGKWHPNGFILYAGDMSPDEPEIPIPTFDGFHLWYPLSEYSALMGAAGLTKEKEVPRLNPSFRDLAFNVARCMVKWGVMPHVDARPEKAKAEERRAISIWEKAEQALKGLAEKYPDDVPDNCKFLLKPRIEQANWVLQAFKNPCWFEWRGKKKNSLWIVNDKHARKVAFHTFDGEQIKELYEYAQFGYGRMQQGGCWSRLISELACWIQGKPHRGLESALSPDDPNKVWENIIQQTRSLHDGSIMDRLEQTSYRAHSTDWHKTDEEDEKGEVLYKLMWYPPWTKETLEILVSRMKGEEDA